jgi:predicted Fe-S protein YdhL (DUF1289 family)
MSGSSSCLAHPGRQRHFPNCPVAGRAAELAATVRAAIGTINLSDPEQSDRALAALDELAALAAELERDLGIACRLAERVQDERDQWQRRAKAAEAERDEILDQCKTQAARLLAAEKQVSDLLRVRIEYMNRTIKAEAENTRLAARVDHLEEALIREADKVLAAEAENTRLRAALKRGINQLQGNIAREEVAEMLRDALAAAPKEDA